LTNSTTRLENILYLRIISHPSLLIHSLYVFTNIIQDHLIFASSLQIPFKPDLLHIKGDYLYHPIDVPYGPKASEEDQVTTIWGLLERSLAYMIFNLIEERNGKLVLLWNGK